MPPDSARSDLHLPTIESDLLWILAHAPQPEQLERLAELLRAAAGASVSAVILFRPPARLATAGGEVHLAVAALERAAAALPPGSVSAAELFLAAHDGRFAGALLAPVYRGDAVSGALYLLFDTAPPPGETASAPLLAAAAAAAVVDRQREQAYAAARAEQFAASLVAAIQDPLITLDAKRAVVALNPAALELFGVLQDGAVGKPVEAVISSAELLQAVTGGAASQQEWLAADGRAFMPHVEAVRGSDDAPEGWVVILNDITRFKRLIRNQSEFTRVVSHDLRTPMTSMKGFADMLEMVGSLNERQKYFIEKILSGIIQMTKLVDNIQDAGRYDPETGFYELSRSQCDICELVTRIARDHLIPAEKQELALVVETAPDVPILNVDQHMVERAVANLIDNAIKYTPNRGTVKIGVCRSGGQVLISVQDNGLGISPENQKLLFERHFRVARPEHRSVKGSGLGLFIVRSVAQRHGGRVWVESVDGEGSAFFISIPLEGGNVGGAPA